MEILLIVALFVSGTFAYGGPAGAVDHEVWKWTTRKAMDECFGRKLKNLISL